MNAIQAWWSQNQDTLAIVGVAAIIGALVGLQRVFLDWRASIRVHVLVAIGAALFVHLPLKLSPGLGPGELVQGVATGIGFLGAGVILQRPDQNQISGISVAGTIWMTAALGMTAGLGLMVLPVLIALAVLIFVKLV